MSFDQQFRAAHIELYRAFGPAMTEKIKGAVGVALAAAGGFIAGPGGAIAAATATAATIATKVGSTNRHLALAQHYLWEAEGASSDDEIERLLNAFYLEIRLAAS